MIWYKLKRRLLLRLASALQRVWDAAAEQNLPQFANQQRNLTIKYPCRIAGADRITIGDDVFIGPNSVLKASTQYPGPAMTNDTYPVNPVSYDSHIEIGHRVSATGSLQLTALCKIVIEDDVMFASNINLTDALHGYEDANIPYKYQKMVRNESITVGRGSWIGQNVLILPGVSIGEQCIIGANSTVSHSIPDRCIAVGSPARVISRWSEDTRQWEKV